MPADTPYNPDGSIDWSYFNRPAVQGQVYEYNKETGGYDTTLSLEAAQEKGYGSLTDTEKREIYNTAAILNPDVGNAPYILGQPEVGQEYRSMNTGDPVPTTKPPPVENTSVGIETALTAGAAATAAAAAAALAKKNGGNGKVANGENTGDNMELFGMDLSGILPALGITGGVAGLAATVLGALRTKFPWDTPEGEGFIAPWTAQTEVAPDVWGQTGKEYAGITSGSLATGGVAGTVARSWTNAAKNGTTPATANYIQLMDGKIYAQSLKTGVIKRVRQPRMVHLHSNMSLGTYIRGERMLDSMSRRIARRTKSLKRA